jgi:hypothetical protein
MIPTKDSLLAGWSSNADEKLTASATTYGCTSAQATQYHTLHLAWMAAYDAVVAAKANGSQTKQLTQAKETAKTDLLDFAREIYAFVQASLTVADEDKVALGVHVPDREPSPKPLLTDAPTMKVEGVYGRQFRLSITDGDSRRQRPFNANGVLLYSFVGESAPSGAEGWTAEGALTRSQVIAELPESVAPGSKVWFTCAYFNARGAGPACTPIFAYTNHLGALAA